jgi:hypothetical protein
LKISSKTTATSIALFLMLTIASFITFLPTASAREYYYTSYVYCAVSPDLVGVNQEVLLVMWTADMPPDIGEIAAAAGERAHWNNVGFYLTDPEGNTETFTIEETDPVGGGFISYKPDQVGTYTVQAWFPKTVKDDGTNQRTYSEGESPEVTFTVQEEPIELWLESPLPTGYWTRPINQASRNWYVLGGNWLGGAHEQPAGTYGGTTSRFVDGRGTESAHILWTKPYYLGGLMEERFDTTGYQTGHYQGLSHMVRYTIMSRLTSTEATHTCGGLQASPCQR